MILLIITSFTSLGYKPRARTISRLLYFWNYFMYSVAKSCPTLCNLMDCSPPRCSVHGIFQARILMWVAISSSGESSWPRDWTYISCRCLLHWQTASLPLAPPEKSKLVYVLTDRNNSNNKKYLCVNSPRETTLDEKSRCNPYLGYVEDMCK